MRASPFDRVHARPMMAGARWPLFLAATTLAATLAAGLLRPTRHGAPPFAGPRPASAQGARLFLPTISRRWPLNVCLLASGEAEAVEEARSRAESEGLGPPPGASRPAVIAADRLTAVDYDDRFGDVDRQSLLTGKTPAPPPWACYWRIELRGLGRHLGGRPGSTGFRVNHFVDVFAAEPCDTCFGMWLIEWRTEPTATPTATVAATPTASPSPTDAVEPTAPVSATATAMLVP